jgi:hypothetical protein
MPIGEELTNELHQKRSTIILSPMDTAHLGMVVRIARSCCLFWMV